MMTSGYAQMLRAWRLYDCSGARASPGDGVLAQLWRRWRGTRGKPVTATLVVTQESLDASWTAFAHRWNAEPRFADVVPIREEHRRQHSVHELREAVCELSWDADRVCCYVHYHGAVTCATGFASRDRARATGWASSPSGRSAKRSECGSGAIIARCPSSSARAHRLAHAVARVTLDVVHDLARIRRFARVLPRVRAFVRVLVRVHQVRHAELQRRTRLPCVVRGGESRASGRDTPWSTGSTAPDRDVAQRRDDRVVTGHDDREGARRSSAGAQRYPRAAEGHRGGNVYAAPEETHPAPAAAVPLAEELREVDRRVGFLSGLCRVLAWSLEGLRSVIRCKRLSETASNTAHTLALERKT